MEQNLFAMQFQYAVTLANCNKASIKKLSAHYNFRGAGLFQDPLNLLKTDVSQGTSGLSGWLGNKLNSVSWAFHI